MKPINSWGQEEINHFHTSFMGKCWHETKHKDVSWNYRDIVCKHCGISAWEVNKPPTFDKVKSFMGKKWLEMWEGYLQDVANDLFFHVWDNAPKVGLTLFLTAVLDLSNLVAFLLEPEQIEKWGWVECPECKGTGGIGVEFAPPLGARIIICPKCKEGKIKHPALEYAEELE